jgi:MFS family permease
MVDARRLGEARWSSANTWTFISFAVGLLLESYVFSLPSIADTWVKIPTSLTELMLAWAPIWLIIGIGIAGPMADRLGRKVTLYVTLGAYAVGGILLVFAQSYVLILVSLALMLMAGGGEMNSIMVATHELMPRRHRGKAMMMEINAINLGGLVLGLLALSSATSAVPFQRGVVGAAVLLVVVILLFARANMPESVLWLEKRGRHEEALRQVKAYWGDRWQEETAPEPPAAAAAAAVTSGIPFRMVVMIVIAAANTIGFGLVAYTFAYHFFPGLQPTILVVYEGIGFAGGFLGLFADRVSRRQLLFWSFAGTFVLTVILGLTTGWWSHDMTVFWILVGILAVVNSLCYLTEDTVKAEVWPTVQRGTLTAVARFVSIGLYIPAIYLTANMPVNTYFLFNAGVWLAGLIAAGAWLWRGHETGLGMSIEAASGEVGGA